MLELTLLFTVLIVVLPLAIIGAVALWERIRDRDQNKNREPY